MDKNRMRVLSDLVAQSEQGFREREINVGACFCMGPQNGQPVCPCAMKFVIIKDGRYVSVRDLGPAPTKKERRVSWNHLNMPNLNRRKT